MAALTTAEKLPERADYSVSHRQPPAIPAVPYNYTNLSERNVSNSSTANDTESLSVRKARRRGGSFAQLFRPNSSNGRSQSRQNTEDVPPLPTAPAVQPPQLSPAPAKPVEADRKSSFSTARKISIDGRNMLRKSSSKARARAEIERLEEERRARLNAGPPSLPLHSPLPGIDPLGGDINNSSSNLPARTTNFSRPGFTMPSSNTTNSSSPAYAIRSGGTASSSPPNSSGRTNGEYVHNPMSRTESMTHRGRYSYASSMVSGNVSSPRRIRRRKDPTPFNILVMGTKSSGKTSFISFLRQSLALPSGNRHTPEPEPTISGIRSSFMSHYLETEMDGERVGVTLWDSAGLERHLIDLQLREMTAFVESKFEETFAEEQKVVRSPGVKDTHIHCVFLVLDPIRLDATVATEFAQRKQDAGMANVSALDDDLDLQVLRVLWGKTTVIPIISKADTLTVAHMAFLKRAVWDGVRAAKLDPLEALELEDDLLEEDEEDAEDGANGYDGDSNDDDSAPSAPRSKKEGHKRHSSLSASIRSADDETPYIPMSILSPDPYDMPPYVTKAKTKTDKVGRRFAWGFADPYNAEHCDFTRLRDSIFIEWRGELRDLSRSKWYENWRTSRLKNIPGSKQRVKGGVTPVAAVPSQGLTSRTVSANSNGNGIVPRAVSAGSTVQPSKAERMLGVENRNGTYENVETVLRAKGP